MFRLSGFNVFAVGAKTVEQCKVASQKFETKIKGTFMEKLATYLKTLYADYKEVAVSVRTDIKEKPFKATLVFTGIGCVLLSLRKNPDEQSFKAKYIDCANEVSIVHPNLVNPHIIDHLAFVQKCYNKDLIRHSSFGLFSIIWVDKYSKDCDIYESNCSYLKLPYRKFGSSIIDIGFLNIWWVISRKMLDYDINY